MDIGLIKLLAGLEYHKGNIKQKSDIKQKFHIMNKFEGIIYLINQLISNYLS